MTKTCKYAPRSIVSILISVAAIVLPSCATVVTLDSTDSVYARGKESFQAERWSEAQKSLADFVRSSCTSGPKSGCQRAVWMEVLADLKAEKPAQAIVDSSPADALGPPMPELEPPITALRQRAHTALNAAWASQDRSARLQVRYVNQTSYQLKSLEVSLDLRDPVLPALPPPRTEVGVIDLDVPAGDHVLTLAARFTCDFRGGQFEMQAHSSHTFSAKPRETVRVLTKTYEKADLPLALPPERLSIDFVVTAPDGGK